MIAWQRLLSQIREKERGHIPYCRHCFHAIDLYTIRECWERYEFEGPPGKGEYNHK